MPAVLARSVLLNLLGQIGTLAIGFVASVALARWLGPTDRGLFGVLYAVAGFGFVVGGVGMPLATLYYASARNARQDALLGNSLLYSAALAVVLVPTAWALRGTLADTFSHGRNPTAWVLATALIPLMVVDNATQNQVVGQLRFGYYNASAILARLASLAVFFALVVGGGLGVDGALLSLAALSLVMLTASLRQILPAWRPRVDRALLRATASYGARVQIGAIFSTLNYRLDVVVLQFFQPLSAVGYYVVAQVVAELVGLVASAFQNSVVPLVARADEADRAETTAAGIRHHGIAAAVAIAVLAGAGPAIILFGYGSAYSRAVVPMLILLPGMWFVGTGGVVTGDLRGRGRPGLSSLISGLAVVVTVVLDVALIPPFGVTGAAIASVVAYTTYGSVSLVALSRLSGLSVRSLAVPTRADFAAYPAFARRLLRTLRPPRPAATSEGS